MANRKNSGGTPQRIGAAGVILVILVLIASFLGIDVTELLEDTSQIVLETDNPESPSTTGGSVSNSGDWYEIYFTNPSCPPEEERAGGVDERIAEDMLTAQIQVDVASFDLDSEAIIEAMITLEVRGVPVRVVVDDEHTPEGVINRLRRNGMSVIIDDRSALMHNKFIVIDGRYVWTGSLNFSSNGVHCNNNNLVRIDAPELAANYTAEMEEMYIDRAFGPTSPKNTADTLTINGVQIENYFTSEDEIATTLGRTIARADSEILFLAFSFTHEDIGEAMIERAEAGVDVRGVFEKSGAGTRFSYFGEMVDLGLDNLQVREDGNSRIMHHKVIIVDRSVVVLGSYNFSANAEDRNDENVLIVYDPEFASFFVEEFDAVWAEAES